MNISAPVTPHKHVDDPVFLSSEVLRARTPPIISPKRKESFEGRSRTYSKNANNFQSFFCGSDHNVFEDIISGMV
jgi:hypothetical protein